MPSWNLHRKYARMFLESIGVSIDEKLIDDINKLIDDPREFFEENKHLVEKIIKNCDETVAIVVHLRINWNLNFVSPIFAHDWGTHRLRMHSAVYVVRKIAECIYGRVGELLVDLHASLDAISRWDMDLNTYVEWSRRLSIVDEVINFVKRIWNLLIEDIHQEK